MPREYNLRKDLAQRKTSKKATATKSQHAPLQQQAKKPSAHLEPNKQQNLQQLILNVFSESFSQHAKSAGLIQELKQHLFNRDFLAAFSRQDLLEAYALRWSPSRALAYLDLFCSCDVLSDALEDLFLRRPARRRIKGKKIPAERDGPYGPGSQPLPLGTCPAATLDDGERSNKVELGEGIKATCLGAGSGAEVVAFAGYLHWLRYGDSQDDGLIGDEGDPLPGPRPLLLQTIDIADWSSVINSLVSKITSPSELSTSTSTLSPPPSTTTTKNLTNPSRFQTTFSQLDILSPASEPQLAQSLQSSSLVTLMFTLNELYTTSMSRTTTLLLTLTSIMEPGSLLLVIDSPGSYSTVKLNKRAEKDAATDSASRETAAEEKSYPMQWLLDHILIAAPNVGSSVNAGGEKKQWEKVHAQESRWFRLPVGLKYPIGLEDMRFQVHLYRKL